MKINTWDDLKGILTGRATLPSKSDDILAKENPSIQESQRTMGQSFVSVAESRKTQYEQAPSDDINLSIAGQSTQEKRDELSKIKNEIKETEVIIQEIKREHSKDPKNDAITYAWQTEDDEKAKKGYGLFIVLLAFVVSSFLGSYLIRN